MEPLPFPEFDETFIKALEQELARSRERPFTVSIMGQTGVGKTSLLKVLFDMNTLVDHVRPATRKPEPHSIRGENGQSLTITDLPGIGESSRADQNYLDLYRQHFHDSDLVLWAIQADNRSTALDAQALDHLLGKLDAQAQEQLMSKLTIVLTKVDTLVPAPWVMAYNNPDMKFLPDRETRELIQQKQEFFQEQLILPFGSHIISCTHNDVNFALDEPAFSYDKNKVTYRGLLTKKRVEELAEAYPQYKKVFVRLYDNYCPVPCSARYKYNLPQLLLVILNKLGSDAAQSFERIVNSNLLENMSLDEARQLCNLLVWSMPEERKIFDLEEGIFPDPKHDAVFYKKKTKKKETWLRHPLRTLAMGVAGMMRPFI